MASHQYIEGDRALEDDLVEGCRKGSTASYQRLYEVHGAKMKSLAVNLLNSSHDAEDAIQETFLRIYRNMNNFKGESAFGTWI